MNELKKNHFTNKQRKMTITTTIATSPSTNENQRKIKRQAHNKNRQIYATLRSVHFVFSSFFFSLYSRLFRTFLTDECKRCDCGEFRIIKLYEWMLFVSITFIAQFCIRCLCSHSFDWLKCSLSLSLCVYVLMHTCIRFCVRTRVCLYFYFIWAHAISRATRFF